MAVIIAVMIAILKVMSCNQTQEYNKRYLRVPLSKNISYILCLLFKQIIKLTKIKLSHKSTSYKSTYFDFQSECRPIYFSIRIIVH